METLYGYYSATRTALKPNVVWKRPDGTEVEVFMTSKNPNLVHPLFSDAVNIGEVTEFVRSPD